MTIAWKMNSVVRTLYQILPNRVVRFVGSRRFLRPLRDKLLRENGYSKTVTVDAYWKPEDMHFKFKSNIKTSVRAERRGVESSLLKLSLKLLKYKAVPSDRVILDVGASFGYLSLVWGQTVSRSGKVYSFEASPHVYSCLAENVRLNSLGAIVTPFNRLVFEYSGFVVVEDWPSTSSISRKTSIESADEKTRKKSISIDDFVNEQALSRVDLIKIDVDGVEYEILRGARESLKRFMPILIVESNDDIRIAELALSLGYKLFDMNMKPFEKQMPNNLVCLPV